MFNTLIRNIYKNSFEYSLYFLTMSLFFGNAPLSIAYVIFLIVSIPKIYNKFKIKEFLSSLPFLLPCLYFIVNLAILLFLAESFRELVKVEKLLPFLLFPIIFFSQEETIKSPQTKSTFFLVFIFSAFSSFMFSISYGLYRMFFAEIEVNSIYITYNHLASLFNVQPIYLTLFYLIAIILCVDLYIEKKFRKLMVFFGLVLLLGIILLSSRTGLMLSMVFIIIKILKIKKFNKFYIWPTLLLIIFCAALTFSLPNLKNRIINFDENISSYSGVEFRLKIWKNAWAVSKESPLYGHGYHKSRTSLLNQYQKVNFRRAYLAKLDAHNQYIQSFLDNGIFGFVLLLIILFIPIRNFKTNTITYTLFTLIMIIALIPESFFSRQYGVIFFILFYTFFLTRNQSERILKMKD